jgi:hypothetical protein
VNGAKAFALWLMERFMFDFTFIFVAKGGDLHTFEVLNCCCQEEAEADLDYTHIWDELGCKAKPIHVRYTPSGDDGWDVGLPF